MTKTFKTILGLILAWALAAQAGVVIAQSPNITPMHTAATATGNGTALVVNGPAGNPANTIGAAGVQIANSTGTFTITFETLTSGSTWTAVMATNMTDDVRATTATAAGQYTILLGGAVQLRARISACSSCNVTVVGRLVPGLVARVASGGGGGGSGTVTSVGWTGGIVSVATATTTPAFTIAGTSGGIPYFSSASTWATSAALAANAIVIGGGAGVAPSTTTTGTGVLTALAVNTGSAGAFVVNGGAGGTPSSLTLTNATSLPPTTGISGWPANASGVLTNNGSGTLSWGAGGSTSPGGSSKQIQVNISGAFAGASGFEYDATADWTLSATPASGKTGLLVYEPGSTPPATVQAAPVLQHLHVTDEIAYWALGYSSNKTTAEWANYLSDQGELIFNSSDNGGGSFGQLEIRFAPTTDDGQHFFYPKGFEFISASTTYYGGIGEVASDIFGLMLTTDSPTSGALFPLRWSNSYIDHPPFGASAGNTTEHRYLELAANGTNYVGFKAPDAITANKIWTLPSADGTSGQLLSTNGSGVLSFAAGLTLVGGTAKMTSYTVATLPAAATVGAGARAFVTDALTPVFGSAVTGGGAVGVPVYSDGSTWLVG